jgi:protein SCO1/2
VLTLAGWRDGRRLAVLVSTADGGAARAQLADAVGFRYKYDETSKQFAHDAVAFVLTPEGPSPATCTASTIRRATSAWPSSRPAAAASAPRSTRSDVLATGTDPATAAYAPFVMGFMRIGALTVFVALAIAADRAVA